MKLALCCVERCFSRQQVLNAVRKDIAEAAQKVRAGDYSSHYIQQMAGRAQSSLNQVLAKLAEYGYATSSAEGPGSIVRKRCEGEIAEMRAAAAAAAAAAPTPGIIPRA